MKQALMIVDVQKSFTPPPNLIAGIARLLPLYACRHASGDAPAS
jgi:nicotinamidase-related amidase